MFIGYHGKNKVFFSWRKKVTTIGHIEEINRKDIDNSLVLLDSKQLLYASGWVIAPTVPVSINSVCYFFLEELNELKRYYGCLIGRRVRTDLVEAFQDIPSESSLYAGFDFFGNLEDVPSGSYLIGCLQESQDRFLETKFNLQLNII